MFIWTFKLLECNSYPTLNVFLLSRDLTTINQVQHSRPVTVSDVTAGDSPAHDVTERVCEVLLPSL